MAAFDNSLMFRTTGNLTASGSTGPLTIRSTPVHGLAVRIVIPTAFNDNDQLQAKIYESADASTYNVVAETAVLTGFNAAPGDLMVPFISHKKYVKLELIVTSTTAANINFGAVKAGLVFNSGPNWQRAENFE